jgi:hypothetical protein
MKDGPHEVRREHLVKHLVWGCNCHLVGDISRYHEIGRSIGMIVLVQSIGYSIVGVLHRSREIANSLLRGGYELEKKGARKAGWKR